MSYDRDLLSMDGQTSGDDDNLASYGDHEIIFLDSFARVVVLDCHGRIGLAEGDFKRSGIGYCMIESIW